MAEHDVSLGIRRWRSLNVKRSDPTRENKNNKYACTYENEERGRKKRFDPEISATTGRGGNRVAGERLTFLTCRAARQYAGIKNKTKIPKSPVPAAEN